MPVEIMLIIGAVLLSALSAYFLYLILHIIVEKIPDPDPRKIFEGSTVSCGIASVVTVISAQIMAGAEVFSMGCPRFIWNALIVSTVILFIYCLLGRILPAVFLGSGLFMVISIINAYIYEFRARLFEPVDIFSIGTAMNVAENYSLFPIPLRVLIGWGIFAGVMVIVCFVQREIKAGPAAKKRCILLAACVISSVAITFYAADLETHHWYNAGASFNGYILDFVSKFKEISATEPDDYSAEYVDALADRYAADHNGQNADLSDHPHIIVIMDEAFSDLSVVGDFSTNTDVMPFISALKENAISGYTLVSVYGGNTANSEYEFLTGNSLAWLSPNTVPYQQYVRDSTYSMVSYLKSSCDYRCVAMHPFQASGWNRPVVYEHLGFDECYFVEDFPQENYIRQFISDREMFEFLIKTYEAQKEEPLFIFGVTMQNHGGYTYVGENYRQSISLEDQENEYPDVEQYLSLIHETDSAVEYLISYFQNVDEDVVIVFFGDHQPRIDESFYEDIGGTADTLDERQKRYQMPFFIWANYEIEEEYVDCISLNYLSSYVYDVAGIELPAYNRFLREMEETVPVINANGFYSISAGCYLPFDEATEDEQEWLELYEVLQYNSIFDTAHRNEVFFPALE